MVVTTAIGLRGAYYSTPSTGLKGMTSVFALYTSLHSTFLGASAIKNIVDGPLSKLPSYSRAPITFTNIIYYSRALEAHNGFILSFILIGTRLAAIPSFCAGVLTLTKGNAGIYLQFLYSSFRGRCHLPRRRTTRKLGDVPSWDLNVLKMC